ncbi:O-acetylhomoserine/O-acetylserine sulfhydrylase [Mycena belliarum]|uniref:O-acetylhomoserine/O-acetylserine sulfhydrylase n=1 Tax=Mycena belliarum TaxID=1033014 RepID=A0AAD6TXE7_9AGAR|nr:O-acetylhomoserine/O-acetylserine sulfhydrylase [Mycena belliae]
MPFALRIKWEMLRNMSACHNALGVFLTLQGLDRTLGLRADNALALARYLENHPKVTCVLYPGLKSHPEHLRAIKPLREDCFGGIVCFGISGHPRDIVDALKLASNLSHMGDAKTVILIIHPGSTTNQVSNEEVNASGVRRDLIWIAVGIDRMTDSIAEFRQALEHVGSAAWSWGNLKYCRG